MTPAAVPLRAAAVALLTEGAGASALSALNVNSGDVTVSGAEGRSLPYVEVQGGTEPEGERSDQTRSTAPTLTFVVRAATLTTAEKIGAVLVSLLASRFAVEGMDVTGAALDNWGPPFQDPPPGSRPWSLPVRFRYTVYQPADPGE